METRKKREEMMARARVRHSRKAPRRPRPDVVTQVKEAAAAAAEKVGELVKAAASGVMHTLTGTNGTSGLC